jgi:hypothetical protein
MRKMIQGVSKTISKAVARAQYLVRQPLRLRYKQRQNRFRSSLFHSWGVGEFKSPWGIDETSVRVQRAKPTEAPNFPCFSSLIVDYMQNLYPKSM